MDDTTAVLEVADTGCGIPEEERERIFLPMVSFKGEHARGDTPQNRVRGTGLGLSISQTIVEDHGGEIRLASEVDVGTTVTVRLPLALPTDA
jgi:cell cycle sensor histidine kinase DivJ